MAHDPASLAQQHFAEGVSEYQRGNTAAAIASYRQALQLVPEFPEALNNLGAALRQAGDAAAAERCYLEALRLRPGYAETIGNLGNLYATHGRLDEAIALFRAAIERHPGFIAAYGHLALTLRRQGKESEAIGVLEALFQHGRSRQALRDPGGAIACYEEMLRHQPDNWAGYNNLGTALMERWDLDRAMAALHRAAELRPDLPEPPSNLGTVHLLRGDLDAALECYRRALELKPDQPLSHSNLLMVLNYDPATSPEVLLAEHRAYARAHAAAIRPLERPASKARAPKRRLRVGYLSPDFHDHPVSRFFEPILSRQDRKLIETFCYSPQQARDAMTSRLESSAGHWLQADALDDRALAERIRDDGIDVLVDLAGHTRNNRLLVFAHRPSPVQVAYLGYPSTTGLAEMDYLLTDEILDPPGEAPLYTEELVRLRGGFCPFAPPADAPAVSELPASRAGAITFGSTHNLAKLNGKVLDLWCRVLEAVPSSRLLIYRNNLTPSVREHLLAEFAARNLAPERVALVAATDGHQRFLGGYALMDVLLDTVPFCGHTVTCEALWMGVPVLTLYGERRAGRMSASVLKHAGLAEWIARTPDEFVRKAVAAAADTRRLATLRADLRGRLLASALCDCDGFTRHFDAALLNLGRARRSR